MGGGGQANNGQRGGQGGRVENSTEVGRGEERVRGGERAGIRAPAPSAASGGGSTGAGGGTERHGPKRKVSGGVVAGQWHEQRRGLRALRVRVSNLTKLAPSGARAKPAPRQARPSTYYIGALGAPLSMTYVVSRSPCATPAPSNDLQPCAASAASAVTASSAAFAARRHLHSCAAMLHSFMILSGRGGIVLFRKNFTKALNQPRLIAGLVTALCEFSIGSGVGLPVSTIDLDNFSVSVVEIPVDDLEQSRGYLRAIVFYDCEDVSCLRHLRDFCPSPPNVFFCVADSSPRTSSPSPRTPDLRPLFAIDPMAPYAGRLLWPCARLGDAESVSRNVRRRPGQNAARQRRGRRRHI